jgi:ABC transport system ATP-binding/permease protein
MPAPLLLLQEINLTFGITPLLSGAELAVAAGDRICLVGRNGSGKSTLLRIAAGLVQSDAGYRFAQPGATIRCLSQEPDLSWQRQYSNQFCLNRFKNVIFQMNI